MSPAEGLHFSAVVPLEFPVSSRSTFGSSSVCLWGVPFCLGFQIFFHTSFCRVYLYPRSEELGIVQIWRSRKKPAAVFVEAFWWWSESFLTDAIPTLVTKWGRWGVNECNRHNQCTCFDAVMHDWLSMVACPEFSRRNSSRGNPLSYFPDCG